MSASELLLQERLLLGRALDDALTERATPGPERAQSAFCGVAQLWERVSRARRNWR